MSGEQSRFERIKGSDRHRFGGPNDPAAPAKAPAEAGRERAEAMGLPWAEPIDLGASIDPGASLPHLLADGRRAVLLFHAGLPKDSDGDAAEAIDPSDAALRHLGWVVFEGAQDVSLGPPNDEGLSTHPLFEAGLEYYRAHEIHPAMGSKRRVVITFHDETLACVCSDWSSGSIVADFATGVAFAADALRAGPAVFGGSETPSRGSRPTLARIPYVQLFWKRSVFEAALAKVRQTGWNVVRFDCSTWRSSGDMHSAVAKSLSFPDYYGRNVAALNDCMWDVAHGAYGFDGEAPGGLVALDRFDEFVAIEPHTAQALLDILARTSTEALERGWRFATFAQSGDPSLRFEPIGAHEVQRNSAEWRTSSRGL